MIRRPAARQLTRSSSRALVCPKSSRTIGVTDAGCSNQRDAFNYPITGVKRALSSVTKFMSSSNATTGLEPYRHPNTFIIRRSSQLSKTVPHVTIKCSPKRSSSCNWVPIYPFSPELLTWLTPAIGRLCASLTTRRRADSINWSSSL